MPNLDGTGPQGIGPTGRGQGGCADNTSIATAGRGFGFKRFGFGGRRGCGLGFGAGCGLGLVQSDKAVLEAQIKAQQAKLDAMNKMLAELDEQDN